MRIRSTCIILGAVLTLLIAPAAAGAATASKATTRAYELDFTLPTAGKSGCTVCHSDPNLVRPTGEGVKSLYVNIEMLRDSAHPDTPCTGCHIDFAFKVPHQNVKQGNDWRAVAKQGCKNCHDAEFAEMNAGAHSGAIKPGMTLKAVASQRIAEGNPPDVPLCGDCHGSHEIPAKKDAVGQRIVRRSGFEMCGKCHVKESDAYSDYYHGAAYRKGALDAPACWDCHGPHDMLPATDRRSPVHPDNLNDTCGKCHKETTLEYVSYARMIHGRAKIESEVPLRNPWWATAGSAIGGFVKSLISIFRS